MFFFLCIQKLHMTEGKSENVSCHVWAQLAMINGIWVKAMSHKTQPLAASMLLG